MKSAEALKDHSYLGKSRKVGDVYYIRRTDIPIMEKLGNIKIVPDPKDSSLKDHYFTTAMEAEPEPVKKKRPYRRKKLAESDE